MVTAKSSWNHLYAKLGLWNSTLKERMNSLVLAQGERLQGDVRILNTHWAKCFNFVLPPFLNGMDGIGHGQTAFGFICCNAGSTPVAEAKKELC